MIAKFKTNLTQFRDDEEDTEKAREYASDGEPNDDKCKEIEENIKSNF